MTMSANDQHRIDPATPDVEELRALAVSTARAAAELIRTRRAELVSGAGLAAGVEHKSSAVDPVTVVDKASEDFIVSILRAARPGDGFIGEEGASVETETGVTWVVDPIDGTVNFLYGIPDYAVSIGAVVDGEPVAGAVINVVQDVLYHAAAGHGAVVERPDQEPRALQVRQAVDVARALVATGFGYSAARRETQARILTHMLPRVRDIRRMGAAALDICRVAEGSVDAYYEHGIKPWDFTAGVIIAREAGAVVRHPGMGADGSAGALFLAASASIFDQMDQLLGEVGGNGVIAG